MINYSFLCLIWVVDFTQCRCWYNENAASIYRKSLFKHDDAADLNRSERTSWSMISTHIITHKSNNFYSVFKATNMLQQCNKKKLTACWCCDLPAHICIFSNGNSGNMLTFTFWLYLSCSRMHMRIHMITHRTCLVWCKWQWDYSKWSWSNLSLH